MSSVTAEQVVAEHAARGRRFVAAGVSSFVLDEGGGEPFVLMHGVPASSFTYRKVVAGLAARGARGIAFDLPGLGLADRPPELDYTWSGLGRWSVAAIDALGLDRFHLVVHDIGGPVGFELAAALPERVRSLTLLDTIVRVDQFRRPWMMEPFAWRGIGRLWLAAPRPVARALMWRTGIADRAAVTVAEVDAYHVLLRREDGGHAFLRIMRGFERTTAKRALYEGVVADPRRPVQVVWAADDPALRLEREGEIARAVAAHGTFHTLPGRHFFQEDQAPALVDRLLASSET
jgi:haloalkane dehalogenase